MNISNLIAFITVGVDKRRAVWNQYRISHKSLIVLSLVG
ncbi:MAG: DUF1294 domain-containing protein [Lewinella sp.]|nr:DUF1294 domain-containing protein [Lewinella sp.]